MGNFRPNVYYYTFIKFLKLLIRTYTLYMHVAMRAQTEDLSHSLVVYIRLLCHSFVLVLQDKNCILVVKER